MLRTVLTTAVTTFALTLLFVVPCIPVLGIEDAISPLRMGIMINAELPFRVLITTAIILDPSVAGIDSSSNKTEQAWTTTFPYGTISGIATCNNISGVWGTAYSGSNDDIKQGTEGVHCWCRMLTPVRSSWVSRFTNNTALECASSCTNDCSAGGIDNINFRNGLFGTAGN